MATPNISGKSLHSYEKITIYNGKIHYFDGQGFNSYVQIPDGNISGTNLSEVMRLQQLRFHHVPSLPAS